MPEFGRALGNLPMTGTVDCRELVACGKLTGVSTWSKIGYNGAIAASTEGMLWTPTGMMTWLAAGQALEVVSTDNTNDKAAGTGALTVYISYLTSTFVEKNETVTMNGSTAVATANSDIFRVNAFRVATAGTGGAAAGTITLRRSSSGSTVSQIAIGETRARNVNYTVPVGKALIIDEIDVASGAADIPKGYARFKLKTTYNDITAAVGTLFYTQWELITDNCAVSTEFTIPLMFPAGTDLTVTATGNAATTACFVSCTIRGRLVLL